jgi:hypothetical protein
MAQQNEARTHKQYVNYKKRHYQRNNVHIIMKTEPNQSDTLYHRHQSLCHT